MQKVYGTSSISFSTSRTADAFAAAYANQKGVKTSAITIVRAGNGNYVVDCDYGRPSEALLNRFNRTAKNNPRRSKKRYVRRNKRRTYRRNPSASMAWVCTTTKRANGWKGLCVNEVNHKRILGPTKKNQAFALAWCHSAAAKIKMGNA